MSSQEQERIETLSVALHRAEAEARKLRSSNEALTRKCNVYADRALEASEENDELRIALGASMTRERVLQQQLDEVDGVEQAPCSLVVSQ